MLMKMQVQVGKLRTWWCRVQHQSVRWPIRGEYECATCYRRYPVPWQEAASSRFQKCLSESPFDHRFGTRASRLAGHVARILSVSGRNNNEQ
jgi:hypothetical protein